MTEPNKQLGYQHAHKVEGDAQEEDEECHLHRLAVHFADGLLVSLHIEGYQLEVLDVCLREEVKHIANHEGYHTDESVKQKVS